MRILYRSLRHTAQKPLPVTDAEKRNVLQHSPVSPAELMLTSDIFGDVSWPIEVRQIENKIHHRSTLQPSACIITIRILLKCRFCIFFFHYDNIVFTVIHFKRQIINKIYYIIIKI